MAASLTSSVLVSVKADQVGALDLTTEPIKLTHKDLYSFASGTGANQANDLWHDQRTLGASATEDLDLNGTLTDAYGVTFSPTKIKALIIKAAAANTNDVVVGGAAVLEVTSLFGAAGDKVNVKPGGTVAFIAPDANGYAMVAGASDTLKIANSAGGTSVIYDIIVIGV